MSQIPHSYNAEKTVLGSLIYNPNMIDDVITQLEPVHFYVTDFARLYGMILDQYHAKLPLTEDMLYEAVINKKLDMDPVKWADISACFATDLQPYIDSILATYKHRNLIDAVHRMKDIVMNPTLKDTDVADACADIEKVLSVTQEGTIIEPRSLDVIIKKALHRITQEKNQPKLKTGFKSLDTITGGFARGQLIVFGGAPSHGKTAFALEVSRKMAHEGKKIGFLSIEMPEDQIGLRLIAQESKVPLYKIEHNLDEVLVNIYPAIQTCSTLPFKCEDFVHIPATINGVKKTARMLKRKYDIDILVVDYLGAIKSTGKYGTKDAEITECINDLKMLAKELDIPVITLCAINRENQKRMNPRPKEGDLRDSGNIAFTADIILLFYNEYKENPETTQPRTIEVSIAKNRNGKAGDTLYFDYDGPTFSFVEETRDQNMPSLQNYSY